MTMEVASVKSWVNDFDGRYRHRPLSAALPPRTSSDGTAWNSSHRVRVFAARSQSEVYDALEAFLTSFSDETPSRLATTTGV